MLSKLFLHIKTGLFLSFLWVSAQSAYGQWNVVYNLNTAGETVQDLSYNPDHSIQISRSHTIIRSDDNGLTWNSPVLPLGICSTTGTYRYNGIDFFNKDTGYVGGAATSLEFVSGTQNGFSTFNCGMTFYSSTAPYVDFIDANIGYAISPYGYLFKTTNAGNTWIQLMLGDAGTGYFVSFINADTGFFSRGDIVYKTVDGGVSCFVSKETYGFSAISADFVNDTVGYVILKDVFDKCAVVKTDDGGTTWTEVMGTEHNLTMTDIHFTSEAEGYICGVGFILYTQDAGAHWSIQRYANTTFYRVDFINVNEGIIAGNRTDIGNTVVYHTINKGGSYNPFTYFYPLHTACCADIPCTIFVEGDPTNTFSWYVDGVLVSSTFVPALTLTAGSHSIKVTTSDGSLSDDFTLVINSVGPLPTSYTASGNLVDSTICPGGTVKVTGINGYLGVTFALYDDTAQISPTHSTSGGSFSLTSYAISGGDFVMSLIGETNYPYCPGNSIQKEFNIYVYPSPPDSAFYALDDSICAGDTAQVELQTVNGYVYTLKDEFYTGSIEHTQVFTGDGSPYDYSVAIPPLNAYSHLFVYSYTDSNSCYQTSQTIKVTVDSVRALAYTTIPAVITEDTVTLLNLSWGTNSVWNYPTGTLFYDTSAAYQKVGFSSLGQREIILTESNHTGCTDTDTIYINACDINPTSSDAICSEFITDALSPDYLLYCFKANTKIFVDRQNNTYIAGYKWDGGGIVTDYSLVFSLRKYSPVGVLLWNIEPVVDDPGNNFFSFTINDVDVDSLGNLYMVGDYASQTLTLGSISILNTSNKSHRRSYVAKIDVLGNCQWIININHSGVGSELKPVTAIQYVDNSHIYFELGESPHEYQVKFTDTLINIAGMIQINTNGELVRQSPGIYTPETSAYYPFSCSGESYSSIMKPVGAQMKVLGNRIVTFDVYGYYVFLPTGAALIPDYLTYTGMDEFGMPYYTGVMGLVSIYDTAGHYIRSYQPFNYFSVPNESYLDVCHFDYQIGGHPFLTIGSDYSIYTSWFPYNEYPVDSLPMFTQDRYVVNGVGLIEGQGGKGLVQKHDTTGNILYTNFTSSKIFGLTSNRNGNIYGIANYPFYASFDSQDNHPAMVQSHHEQLSTLVFGYDPNGNLIMLEPFVTDSFSFSSNIVTKDPCNSDLFFAVVGNDSLSFLGQTVVSNFQYVMYRISPEGSCTDNLCPWSDFSNVTEHIAPKNHIMVHPNPFDRDIFVAVMGDDRENSLVQITDLAGHQVTPPISIREDGSRCKINLQGLKAGVYIVRITNKNGSVNYKIVKGQN